MEQKEQRFATNSLVISLAISLVCVFKVVTVQLAMNMAQFWYLGVDYLDAPALNFEARHWYCSTCMMETSAENGARLAYESWYQVLSLH